MPTICQQDGGQCPPYMATWLLQEERPWWRRHPAGAKHRLESLCHQYQSQQNGSATLSPSPSPSHQGRGVIRTDIFSGIPKTLYWPPSSKQRIRVTTHDRPTFFLKIHGLGMTRRASLSPVHSQELLLLMGPGNQWRHSWHLLPHKFLAALPHLPVAIMMAGPAAYQGHQLRDHGLHLL